MQVAKAVLVTGATGFLGSRLVLACVERGLPVVVLKRRQSDLRRLVSVLDSIRFFDVENGVDAIFGIEGGIEAIIHTATCYGRNGESAAELFDANVASPMKLLEASIAAGVETFINTDSFFNINGVNYKYLNSYSLSKKQFAEWGENIGGSGKIRFVNVRLEHLYGPGDNASKFTMQIVRSCLANQSQIQLTKGEQQRDFIYIDDAVSAYMVLLAKHGQLHKSFIPIGLGFGKALSVRDFVTLAHQRSLSTTELLFGALPYREGEIMYSAANTDYLRDLGWFPVHDLDAGIAELVSAEKADMEAGGLI